MTQSYIVLLTRRTDAENATIRVLDVNFHPTSSLDHAPHLFTEADARSMATHWELQVLADPDLAAWCPTVAPAGEETGVPGQPGGEQHLGGKGKQGRVKDERRGSSKS